MSDDTSIDPALIETVMNSYGAHSLAHWALTADDENDELRGEVERLRVWIDTVGRTCPSNATVNKFLAEEAS